MPEFYEVARTAVIVTLLSLMATQSVIPGVAACILIFGVTGILHEIQEAKWRKEDEAFQREMAAMFAEMQAPAGEPELEVTVAEPGVQ